jgi:hypothetical protein
MARLALLALLALALASRPLPAAAADSLDACDETLATLPAVITAPGTYCLDQNFTLTLETDAAIYVQASNVVVDCHDHLVENVGASAASNAYGLLSVQNADVAVRRCRFAGFHIGIDLHIDAEGARLLVEDSRVLGSGQNGIFVQGNGSVVRRNRVFDTVAPTPNGSPTAMVLIGNIDVLDNTIAGVVPNGTGRATGIYSLNNLSGTIAGNRIRNVAGDNAIGIRADTNRAVAIRGNDLVGEPAATDTTGLYCSAVEGRARDNVLSGWDTGILTCGVGAANVVKP